MLSHIVPITQLAAELGVERTNARKIALKYGYLPTRQQIEGLGRRQRLLCWTREQADAIVAERRRQGFSVPT